MSSRKQQNIMDFKINGNLVKQSVKSFVLSKKYTRIVLKASVFNIICRRLPINKDELDCKEYNGASFFILKGMKKNKNIENPFIETFLAWLKGIKDAIDKNYLKSVYILLKESEGNVVESYSFNLKYNTDPNFSNKNEGGKTPEDVKGATTTMFNSISALENIPKLSPEITLDIEFMYNDDCPMDYEPPGFVSSVQPMCLQIKTPTRLGKVNTGFHSVMARSSKFQKIIASEEDQSKVQEDQNILDDLNTDKGNDIIEEDFEEDQNFQDDLNTYEGNDIIEEDYNNLPDHEMIDVISIGDQSVASEGSSRFPKAIIDEMDHEDDPNTYLDDSMGEEVLAGLLDKTRAVNTSNVTIPDQDMSTPNIFTEEEEDDVYLRRTMNIFTLTEKIGALPMELLNSMEKKDKKTFVDEIKKFKIYRPDPADPENLQKGFIDMEKLSTFKNALKSYSR
ncbi:uncharacterized protein LOC126887043 isoform X2 [Diabrotica virgifera virgifera]|uniref:HORMA domain-containing protein n=1 Tax=Diabrotica virgifera virgifera TaxID=50390 RepID=A0ABM5KJD3_DIAVI|nr:uncharacterized protein LOC126887043 isoform X2 [Diabrotica virgifera virgifera]